MTTQPLSINLLQSLLINSQDRQLVCLDFTSNSIFWCHKSNVWEYLKHNSIRNSINISQKISFGNATHNDTVYLFDIISLSLTMYNKKRV